MSCPSDEEWEEILMEDSQYDYNNNVPIPKCSENYVVTREVPGQCGDTTEHDNNASQSYKSLHCAEFRNWLYASDVEIFHPLFCVLKPVTRV